MHILQLNFEKGWRGGEQQTLLSMRYFRSAGHKTALLARKGEPLAQAAQKEGFVVYEATNAAALCLKLLTIAHRFDILHAQTANTLTWLTVLKYFLHPPIAFTRRTAFPIHIKKQCITYWKWSRVDILIAISAAAANEPRRLGLTPEIIPDAVEAKPVNVYRSLKLSQQLNPQARKVLATAAALTREKDPCTLVKAIHALSQTRDDFIFLHLGDGGDAEHEARSLVKQLNLQDYYIFAGFQRGLEDIYPLMDVFVLTSTHEALGSSVLDAFLYSVPVVATNVGGLTEILADGRGLLCEAGDHQAIAQSIAHLLDNPTVRNNLTQKAHAYVTRQHHPQLMADNYLVAYQRQRQA